ncbi:MAG: TonB family protein [Acidobacteria bacterium]|nr:TonB family protein [Acidobacteriota bacterium]
MKSIVLAVAAALAASAASIGGSVFDPSGSAIPKALIKVVKAGDPADWTAESGGDGRYELTALPTGRFELQVMVPGFALFRRVADIRSGGDRLEINAVLRLGEIQERLTVVAPGRAAASNAPRRVRVGGLVQPPRLLQQERPQYPDAAKRAGVEGTAMLRAVISVDGSVINVTPLSGSDSALAEAAASAVKQWKYQPALLNGQPVETVTVVEIVFKLAD